MREAPWRTNPHAKLPAGIDKLSAEDQEPLGDWRTLVPEEMRRVVNPPAWGQELEADQALPADADELLEAVPDRPEQESPRPVAPLNFP